MTHYIRVPLTQGKVALVDPEDADRVLAHKWYALRRISNGRIRYYATREEWTQGEKPKRVYLHRFIINPDQGKEVDHRNRNGLDCRRKNLREATKSENARNKGSYRNSTSRYKGVTRKGDRWLAQATSDGQFFWQSYETEIEAARGYDEFAKILHGDFARLNFPARVPN